MLLSYEWYFFIPLDFRYAQIHIPFFTLSLHILIYAKIKTTLKAWFFCYFISVASVSPIVITYK